MVSFVSSMMKDIIVFPSLSRVPVKVICCIAFESTSSVCYLIKSNAIIL